MKKELAERLGEIIDRVDNLSGALSLPMPPDFHVKQMKGELKDLSKDLKEIYLEEENNNPWKGLPW